MKRIAKIFFIVGFICSLIGCASVDPSQIEYKEVSIGELTSTSNSAVKGTGYKITDAYISGFGSEFGASYDGTRLYFNYKGGNNGAALCDKYLSTDATLESRIINAISYDKKYHYSREGEYENSKYQGHFTIYIYYDVDYYNTYYSTVLKPYLYKIEGVPTQEQIDVDIAAAEAEIQAEKEAQAERERIAEEKRQEEAEKARIAEQEAAEKAAAEEAERLAKLEEEHKNAIKAVEENRKSLDRRARQMANGYAYHGYEQENVNSRLFTGDALEKGHAYLIIGCSISSDGDYMGDTFVEYVSTKVKQDVLLAGHRIAIIATKGTFGPMILGVVGVEDTESKVNEYHSKWGSTYKEGVIYSIKK